MKVTADSCLVLGGGGVVGIAWMTGVICGLAEHGIDLARAKRAIGTSAGAVVAAQLLSGARLQDLFARQTAFAQQVSEPRPDAGLVARAAYFMAALREAAESRPAVIEEFLKHVPLAGEEERRAIIGARLTSPDWPRGRLEITALELASGKLTIFDRRQGITLVDAIAASCALPGIWPAPVIARQRYIDGGVRSAENADLARGQAHVIILSPNGSGRDPARSLARQIGMLEADGTKVLLIEPDARARSVMTDLLDPAGRRSAAEAGRQQGQSEAVHFD